MRRVEAVGIAGVVVAVAIVALTLACAYILYVAP